MFSSLRWAIIKTLCYSDIFEYPLTNDEISKWLIKLKIKNKKIITTIKNDELIREKDGYYFLKGRETIVDIRKKREIFSKQKIIIAKKIASFLKIIPTIRLVGITGALALNNVKEDDDIDLLIVTSRNLLWTTRFLVTILVELIGKRRRPNEIAVNNKICLNMFLDENHLVIPIEERNLFSAHEVAQLQPIWDRDNTYSIFLTENSWIRRYLPNILNEDIKKLNIIKSRRNNNPLSIFPFLSVRNFIENFLKYFQLRYMRKKRTTEVIREGVIRFHPNDVRGLVMEKFNKKLRNIQHK